MIGFLTAQTPTSTVGWMLFLAERYAASFWQGTWITLYVAVVGTIVGFVMGFFLGIIQDKRHTAFFIAHSAGAFSFNPGLYSSAELKHFAAQVKALKAGDANG